MNKSKTFPLDIFKHGIKVVIGSRDYLLAVAKKDGFLDFVEKNIEEPFGMITFMLPTGDAMIYSESFDSGTDDDEVMRHEILHAVSHILRNVGIEHTAETEEAYAYALEYCNKRILTWLSCEFP